MMMAFHTLRLQKKISMPLVITSGSTTKENKHAVSYYKWFSSLCFSCSVLPLTEIQVSFIISLCNDTPRGILHRGMISLNLVPLVRVECTH